MKETIIAVVLITLVVGLCIFTTKYTASFCDEIYASVSDCVTAVRQNDWELAKKHIEAAEDAFDKKSSVLEAFVMHQDISEAHGVVLKISAAVDAKATDICISEATSLLGQIRRLSESDRLTLSNIL